MIVDKFYLVIVCQFFFFQPYICSSINFYPFFFNMDIPVPNFLYLLLMTGWPEKIKTNLPFYLNFVYWGRKRFCKIEVWSASKYLDRIESRRVYFYFVPIASTFSCICLALAFVCPEVKHWTSLHPEGRSYSFFTERAVEISRSIFVLYYTRRVFK